MKRSFGSNNVVNRRRVSPFHASTPRYVNRARVISFSFPFPLSLSLSRKPFQLSAVSASVVIVRQPRSKISRGIIEIKSAFTRIVNALLRYLAFHNKYFSNPIRLYNSKTFHRPLTLRDPNNTCNSTDIYYTRITLHFENLHARERERLRSLEIERNKFESQYLYVERWPTISSR